MAKEQAQSSQQEVQAEEAIATEQPTITREPVDGDHTFDDLETQSVEFDPLFEDEDVTEAELMGEEPEPEADTKEPEVEKETAAPQPEGDKEEVTDEGKETLDDGGNKPPKGFVPIQALHQERGQRQMLSQEVQQLKEQLATLSQQKPLEDDQRKLDLDTDTEGFKVLSEEAFEELLEDDPVEAIKYERKLRSYEAQQASIAEAEKIQNESIARAIGMMTEAIPDLYDTNSDVNQKLTDFAAQKGFQDLDGLAVLTDPRTQVVPSGGSKPKPLGETAANLVVFLNNYFKEAQAFNDPNASNELKDSLKAEITKSLLQKIKSDSGTHVSLADLPGDSGNIGDSGDILTEEQFSKLSEAEQKRYLGG